MAKYYMVRVNYCGSNIPLNIDLKEFGILDPSEITKKHVLATMKKCGYLPNDAEESEIIFPIKPHGRNRERY